MTTPPCGQVPIEPVTNPPFGQVPVVIVTSVTSASGTRVTQVGGGSETKSWCPWNGGAGLLVVGPVSVPFDQ